MRKLMYMAALAAALPSVAGAAEYDVFVDIETEEDLYDLQVSEQISDETFETLHELFQRGVDLNSANRDELYSLPNLTYAEVDAILRYRKEVGFIRDPAELVINGVLSEDKLGAIAAFLVVRDPSVSPLAASGSVRLQSRWTPDDGTDRAPASALRARVDTLKNLRVGVAATVTRTRLGDVVHDPNRGALSAERPSTQPHVPKAYALWDSEHVSLVAGTYRIGFGQKLTFDTTRQVTPNGIYGDDELYRVTVSTVDGCKELSGEDGALLCDGDAEEEISGDFRWADGMLGVAAGLKQIPAGTRGAMQVYGFFSYQPKSIYQYDLWDRSRCNDPRDDDSMLPGNEDCSSPDVFVTEEDVFAPAGKWGYSTLPDMYAEMTAGGNVTYSYGARTKVGVTGYGSRVNFLTEGMDLDFQESARTPFNGPWGAVGVDAAHGFGLTDLFLEVAHSFDREFEGGGGPAMVARSVTSWNKQELEGSVRYYSQKFSNPYTRSIAAADEDDGLRARDEYGARVRYSGRYAKRVSVRTTADVWAAPSDNNVSALLYARGDGDVTDQWRLGGQVQFQDKDISDNGGGLCFEVPTEEDEFGETVDCTGKKIQITPVRVRYAPTKKYDVQLQYTHKWLDDGRYMDKMRQDLQVVGIGTARPTDRLRARVRLRYLWEDLEDDAYLERSLSGYADLGYRLRARDQLRVRYDYFHLLDDRDSTVELATNPVHFLFLEYEARF